MATLSNLPSKVNASDDSTIKFFNTYYEKPLEIDAGTYDAMQGFFTGRGFEKVAAESVTMIIISQAKKDGYNPLQILDTLKGLDNVEISALVAEIINYNRFKTSYLGYSLEFKINHEVERNILP
jgi:hypothetical protein